MGPCKPSIMGPCETSDYVNHRSWAHEKGHWLNHLEQLSRVPMKTSLLGHVEHLWLNKERQVAVIYRGNMSVNPITMYNIYRVSRQCKHHWIIRSICNLEVLPSIIGPYITALKWPQCWLQYETNIQPIWIMRQCKHTLSTDVIYQSDNGHGHKWLKVYSLMQIAIPVDREQIKSIRNTCSCKFYALCQP